MAWHGRHRSGIGFEMFIGGGIVVVLLAALLIPIGCGIGGFGPRRTVTGKVLSKHVDISGSGESRASHYMVTTDNGTFEIDNGIVLGVWNSDEIYGALEVGGTYTLHTKGNKWVGLWMQEYPYVTSAIKN